MAIFSEKVISAKFIDPPNNMLIEVLYREGDVAIPYVLEVDFTQQDFNDLLKEISLDEIQDVTKKELSTRAKFFNDIIDTEIERRWALESEKIKQAYDKVDEYHNSKIEEISQIWEIESKKIKEAYQDIDRVWEIESKKIKEAYQDVDQYTNIKNSEISQIWETESKKIEEAYQGVDQYANIKNSEISRLWEIESQKIKEAYQDVDQYANIKNSEISQIWELESQKIKEAYQDVDQYKGDLIKKAYDEVDQYAGSMKSNLAKEYRDQLLTPTRFSIDNLSGKEIFSHILKKNDNKDFVFDLKVGILEDVDIAKSNNKNLKLAIRKAKSVFELIKLYEEAKGIS